MENIQKLRAAGNYAERLAKIVYDLADLVEDFGNFLRDSSRVGADFPDDVSSDDDDDDDSDVADDYPVDDPIEYSEKECNIPNCICKSGMPVTVIHLS
jgi:hypothetical protein